MHSGRHWGRHCPILRVIMAITAQYQVSVCTQILTTPHRRTGIHMNNPWYLNQMSDLVRTVWKILVPTFILFWPSPVKTLLLMTLYPEVMNLIQSSLALQTLAIFSDTLSFKHLQKSLTKHCCYRRMETLQTLPSTLPRCVHGGEVKSA